MTNKTKTGFYYRWVTPANWVTSRYLGAVRAEKVGVVAAVLVCLGLYLTGEMFLRLRLYLSSSILSPVPVLNTLLLLLLGLLVFFLGGWFCRGVFSVFFCLASLLDVWLIDEWVSGWVVSWLGFFCCGFSVFNNITLSGTRNNPVDPP